MKEDFSYLYILVALVPIFLILFSLCPLEEITTSVKETVETETVESSSVHQSSEAETVETETVESSSVEKKVNISVDEAVREIEYLTQNSKKKTIVLLDSFSIFIHDSIQPLLRRLEESLTSNNVCVYMCNESSYREVISYEELYTPEKLPIAIGNYFEVVKQLRKETSENFINDKINLIVLSCYASDFFYQIKENMDLGLLKKVQVVLYDLKDTDYNTATANQIKSYKNITLHCIR